ncbi:MAG: aminoacyl-tRNA hydrolase [Deltaproteobacteria bacterium]|nr:aminoacyl-tRNA hydrolase [Deltaproteobacteria bacterium]
MIQITEDIAIDEKEIQEAFIRASGPGGQNVNKVATAVQLRFDAANSPSLSQDVRRRLAVVAGKRMTDAGVLIIQARRFRTQEQNRQDALERLIRLIQEAALPPKRRRKTAPTLASRERRLTSKRRRAQTKKIRQDTPKSEE